VRAAGDGIFLALPASGSLPKPKAPMSSLLDQSPLLALAERLVAAARRARLVRESHSTRSAATPANADASLSSSACRRFDNLG